MSGINQYWIDGLPFAGIQGDGSQQYWLDGLPDPELPTGQTSTGAIEFPSIALAGVGTYLLLGGAIAFPGPTFSGSGLNYAASGGVSFPTIALSGTGITFAASGGISFPTISLSISGLFYVGTGGATFPAATFSGVGVFNEPPSPTSVFCVYVRRETRGIYAYPRHELQIRVIAKDPAAEKDYWINWTEILQTGETIATVTWPTVTGLTYFRQWSKGMVSYCFIKGGTAGTDYTVLGRITTSLGRTYEREFILSVEYT